MAGGQRDGPRRPWPGREVHLAHAEHCFATSRDNEPARIEVGFARRVLPNSAKVEELAGEIARRQNRWDEALRCLERATTLEPRENVNRFTLANTYRPLRRYDDFDRQMEQVIATMTTREAVALRPFRGLGSLEGRATVAPLRAALATVTPADEPDGELRDEYGLILTLCDHDADAVSRLLAATPHTRLYSNGVS